MSRGHSILWLIETVLFLALCSTFAQGGRGGPGHAAKNLSLGAWSIPKCDPSNFPRGPISAIPPMPCAREDLPRHNLCALATKGPPELPQTLMANAKLWPSRRAALVAHVMPQQGGRMVEVGTMLGTNAKYMLRQFKPAELVVMDVDRPSITKQMLRAHARCRKGGGRVARCRRRLRRHQRELPARRFKVAFETAAGQRVRPHLH